MSQKASQRPAITGAELDGDNDIIYVVDVSAASGSRSKRMSPNELAAFLGVITTGLQYFAESQGGAGESIFSASGGATNIPAVFKPKGTGALQARSAGNARGEYAVDLQMLASANSQVAAGDNSVVIGGSNTASALQAVAIGNTNSLNTDSVNAVAVGYQNGAQGGENSVLIGIDNSSLEAEQILIGDANTLNAVSSVAIGGGNTDVVGATGSFLRGRTAHANLPNQDVFGISNSLLQRSTFTLSGTRVGDGTLILTASGSQVNDLDLPTQNSGDWVWACRLHIAGAIVVADGLTVGDSFNYHVAFIIRSNGGVVQLEGTVESSGDECFSASMATTTVDISEVGNKLQILVTPPTLGAAEQIQCLATLDVLEIGLNP